MDITIPAFYTHRRSCPFLTLSRPLSTVFPGTTQELGEFDHAVKGISFDNHCVPTPTTPTTNAATALTAPYAVCYTALLCLLKLMA